MPTGETSSSMPGHVSEVIAPRADLMIENVDLRAASGSARERAPADLSG